MDNTEEFRLLSLCSGYAGLELGLKRIVPNLRTVAYVEVEAFACANLVAKMETGLLDTAPIWTDIKTFNGWPFRRNIHIITAGYPCQPFSVAGKRQGTDDPRHLWPHIERIIEAVRPVWFFGENVSGHLTIGFPEVYRSLRNLGYTVEAGLFTAAERGAPHRRERLFILAHARGAKSRGLSDCQRQKDSTIRSTSELADTKNANRRRATETPNSRRGNQKIRGQNLWPARPGQPQYEWEEPRVVADNSARHTRKRQLCTQGSSNELDERGKAQGAGVISGQSNGQGMPRKENNNEGIQESRQAQSRLGRATYGTNCSLDATIGDKNETMPNMSKTNNQQGLAKSEILQPSMLLGIPKKENANEGNKAKKSAKSSQSREVRKMSRNKELTKTPSQAKRRQSNDIVPKMPYENSHSERYLGKKESSMRVDRLRLLGNGVVPQQVEKAFRYLMRFFEANR